MKISVADIIKVTDQFAFFMFHPNTGECKKFYLYQFPREIRDTLFLENLDSDFSSTNINCYIEFDHKVWEYSEEIVDF